MTTKTFVDIQFCAPVDISICLFSKKITEEARQILKISVGIINHLNSQKKKYPATKQLIISSVNIFS